MTTSRTQRTHSYFFYDRDRVAARVELVSEFFLGRKRARRTDVKSRLTEEPVGPALRCPVCLRYTTKRTSKGAVMQLHTHLSAAHPHYAPLVRYCNGPLHQNPARLPVSSFVKKGGKFRWCKECWRSAGKDDRPNVGYVPTERLVPFAQRLLDRYGTALAVEQAVGISDATFSNVLNAKTSRTHKKVAALMIAALRDQG
jgi:hypothetical protein